MLRLISRASPLAVAQAEEVRALLLEAHSNFDPSQITLVTQTTKGDRLLDRTLIEAGGKGLFTKELEGDLLAGTADVAIHSTKDVPTRQPDGLMLAGFLPREDVRDVFVTAGGLSFDDLHDGAVVGTASLRRRAQALSRRPDLKIIPFRGNVQTRLKKLAAGEAAGTFLARAGLNRLGLDTGGYQTLDTDAFLPAPGQGAIALQCRDGDTASAALLAPLLDAKTGVAVTAERACLAALDGSCRTPIAAHAVLDGSDLTLRGAIYSLDGADRFDYEIAGPAEDAAQLGTACGEAIRAQTNEAFFETLRRDMVDLIKGP